ncbi:MAG TPA: gas vesicle protein [Ignavibacteria bacterium]|nr:gas vesicle protein [Ignavibacteria bacterium]
MSNDNNGGNGFLIGLIAGSALGAIVGLLYAPKSGKELRDDIRTKSNEYLDDADKYIEDAKVKAKDLINDGKKKSDGLIADAKSKSEELLKEAQKIFDEAKSKTSKTVSEKKVNLEAEGTRLKSAVKAGVEAYKETKKS